MELEYIIEICVAIDIAIMGIAYPVIVDKIANIGDKYSAEYISVLFNNEFPQRTMSITIRKRQYQISFLKLSLYATMFSFLFLIIQIPPFFGWDNFFINNSAKIVVLLFTLILTIFFFIWLDKVVLYNGRSKALLKSIITTYSSLMNDTEIRSYHLKAINEITSYAIEKQDEHLQKTLLEFYSRLFNQLRKNHDRTKPLIYPIDIYFFVNKLNVELSENQNKKLRAIEHRAVSGVWLLGQDFENIQISEETYKWLWHNLNIICDNERFIKMFWANSNQYFDYRLSHFTPNYDFQTGRILNEVEIKKRESERQDFLETHFALGGLLLYKKQHKAIKYIIEYTQSQPPRYALLPDSMTTIFTWFEHFRNEYKSVITPMDSKFYFPELDNLGNRQQVNYWICKYLSILFIRQYSLHTYYIYQDFTSLPRLPDDTSELNDWLDSVSFFEKCLKNVLNSKELLEDLGYTKIVEANEDNFSEFIASLKTKIIDKIGEEKLKAELSKEKLVAFETSTNKIITEAFEIYECILNPSKDDIIESDLKLSVNGSTTIMSKSAFTSNDNNLNYDSVFASYVASDKIKREIPNSFAISASSRYLLNKDNLILGLEKLIGHVKDIFIVAIDIEYEVEEIIMQSQFATFILKIPATDNLTRGVLFVLKKSDFPWIEHKELQEDEIKRLQLKIVNENLKIYTSVIDLNIPENEKIKSLWNLENEKDNLDLKVQLTIAFHSVIYWKKDRKVVQVNIASEYKEQGIQSYINEIEPIDKDKPVEAGANVEG
jgi:hypothetical protein